MKNTITVYDDNTTLWSDEYPTEWSFAALQKLARNWMRHVGGTYYVIRQADGTLYYSKKRKVA